MQNLEQERACHALKQSKEKNFSRQDVSKLPALILGNGLLATAAFALDGRSRSRMAAAMDAIADHLANRKLTKKRSAEEMLDELSTKNSLNLRLATEEALAYLVYLKRFARNDQEK
ncbi:type III-B CRISPR module-associated protein Cmr5 [Methylacidimicrobium tartarophylax]|uniref:CRISPR type III-B/RAMP module-associated protein Cmr5 n=1 Tax=Methylacidimicrobium tartarophylax TaxID=1041768 RepID=A0A5E6MAM6_9BACT|nr:type III-B CRISPR module-associated protein Cmr5 [Methylacidimicrobium tartarophylax]VVM05378.1 hypothetical protein MAMT_00630 [Methylacidimicrobium tartarophylax]